MAQNVNKYLIALEALRFADSKEQPIVNSVASHTERLQHNVKILKKCVKFRQGQILKRLATDTAVVGGYLEGSMIVNENTEVIYAAYLGHVLLTIVSCTNFNSDAKEDLISMTHMNLCIEAAQDLSIFALRYQMHKTFCQSALFSCPSAVGDTPPHYALLRVSVEIFARIFQIKQFHAANAMDAVIRDYMAGIFTLFHANVSKELAVETADVTVLRARLNNMRIEIGNVAYFRNIMLLKSVARMPTEIQEELHNELLSMIEREDGFKTLVATLHITQGNRGHAETEKIVYGAIANIVGHSGHRAQFQSKIIVQIFEFIDLCHTNTTYMENMGAGLLSLRRMYDLNAINREQIRQILRLAWERLTTPKDLLAGLFVLSHEEICTMIATMYHIFCTSGLECLPSELLVDYLPLLLHLHSQLPNGFKHRPQIAGLVTRCLHNRKEEELQNIVWRLYTGLYDTKWLYLHERLVLSHNAAMKELSIRVKAISSKDRLERFSVSLALPALLIGENFNLLIYKVFVVLLRLMGQLVLREDGNDDAAAIDLLQNEDELVSFLNTRFPVKVEIILSLSELVQHEPLKLQLLEHCKEFLSEVVKLIQMRLSHWHEKTVEANDETLFIMLSILQELLEQSNARKPGRDFMCSDLMPLLLNLNRITSNQHLQQSISKLSLVLLGVEKGEGVNIEALYEFKRARIDIESSEPPNRVSGIQQMIAIIQTNNSLAIANEHIIVALGLNMLKDSDSYVFLNCVRLFVALVNVAEKSTLELLVDEYLSDAQKNMDYRLIVGEALIAVGKELGELCYKYRDLLVNCFINGARSTYPELRMSAYGNLGQLCRILAYQVNNFFQELLQVIDSELSTGNYKPAQRAAVLVLGELLEGMDDLKDYGDMLTPIYHRLKEVEESPDSDDQMRVHATNGLKILSAKCFRLLFPEPRLEKQIQVLGIKNNTDPRPTIGLKLVLELD